MAIKEEIFRSYDVRGIYPTDINEEAVEAIGGAIVKYLRAKKVVVGRDMRASSPSLFKALAKGIMSAGADVVDIGMVPTPVVYFTVAKYGYDAGAVVSASHNPPEYNGVKIVKEKSLQLSKDDGIEDIKKLALSGNIKPVKKPGRIIKKDIKKEYFKHILRFARGTKPGLKIIIDAGNGMGGFAKSIFDKLPIDYTAMYFKPDGNYPNHPADPTKMENLKDLINRVKKEKADVGIAFDGDADRAVFIDEKGEVLRPDFYTALIGPEQLKNNKDKRIYYDLRFSHAALDELRRHGAKLVKTRVGNPFYKQGLISKGGAMAAEVSGHIMFPESYGLDDGIIAVVRMLSFLSRQKRPLSELSENIKKQYENSGEINLEVKNSDKVLKGLEEKYGNTGKVEKLDGLTIEYPDWWFNVRSSNTEPLIRVTLETKPDKKFMEGKKKELLESIKKYDG